MPVDPIARLAVAITLVCSIAHFSPHAKAEDDIAEAMESINRQIAANPRDGQLLKNLADATILKISKA